MVIFHTYVSLPEVPSEECSKSPIGRWSWSMSWDNPANPLIIKKLCWNWSHVRWFFFPYVTSIGLGIFMDFPILSQDVSISAMFSWRNAVISDDFCRFFTPYSFASTWKPGWRVAEILHQLMDGFSPLFIGFQPSFWWCRISQPSTVGYGI